MTDTSASSPAPRYLSPEHVLGEMCDSGMERLHRASSAQILVLAAMAGGFITAGALFSILLAQGVEAPGPRALLAGLGFSTGFFFVILSHTVLFTEANVVLPSILIHRGSAAGLLGVVRFWGLAWLGNFLGCLLTGALVIVAVDYPPEVLHGLTEMVEKKMHYHALGGAGAWGRAVLSGVLANWLVGMAAFFATMGRSIVGKYVPVALAVMLFVAAGFQHSPANMGYFALAHAAELGPGWGPALLWNILPAGLGNMVGGSLLVVLPFFFALSSGRRREMAEEQRRQGS